MRIAGGASGQPASIQAASIAFFCECSLPRFDDLREIHRGAIFVLLRKALNMPL